MKLRERFTPVKVDPVEAITAPVSVEILNPISGELVNVDDVDALIGLLDALKKTSELITEARAQASHALAAKTEGTAKTRRLQSPRGRVIRIEMPSPRWDNSRLKEAWHSYPQFREQFLRLAEIAPNLREVNKLRETSGPPDLETFKKLVLAAEREPFGSPYIAIEK